MCNCKNKGGKKGRFEVKLPGGLKITKGSQSEAEAYVKAHPGSTLVVKTSA